MRHYIFIFIGYIAISVALPEQETCDGIIVLNGLNFEEEVLKDEIGVPTQLSIDHSTNTLFFANSLDINDQETLGTAYLNLNTGEYGKIPGINSGTATAVDNKNHVVYLSSIDGIHTYDPVTKTLKLLDAEDTYVWQMFFKDRLYFTDIVTEKAFVIENGKPVKIKELDDHNIEALLIAVDKYENIWFCNIDGLFVYIKDEDKIVHVGDYFVSGFTTDIEGNLIFLTMDGGIYIIEGKMSIKHLLDNELVYGIAVDSNNNLIYSEDGKIVRLNPTDKKCPVK